MEEAAYKGEDEEQEKEFILKDILSVRNYTKLHGDLQLLRFEMKSGDEALRAEIKSSNEALRAEIKSGDEALRAEMRQGDEALRAEINELRTEMRGEFKAVRAELKGATDTLAIAINKLETRIDDFQKAQSNHIVLMGIIAATISSVLSAVIAILAQYFMH